MAGTVLDDDYPISNSADGAWLISPEFIVPSAALNPRVQVWVWSHLRDSHLATISVREVGGDWRELDRSTSPNNSQWTPKRLSLSDWGDRTVQIGFRLYNYFGRGEVARAGFFVDEFSIITD